MNETLEWFESLETGIVVRDCDKLMIENYEIDKIAVVRKQLLNIERNCPGYIDRAVSFAKSMLERSGKTLSISNFFSYLKFFEAEFESVRNVQEENYIYQHKNIKNKPNKKQWTGNY